LVPGCARGRLVLAGQADLAGRAAAVQHDARPIEHPALATSARACRGAVLGCQWLPARAVRPASDHQYQRKWSGAGAVCAPVPMCAWAPPAPAAPAHSSGNVPTIASDRVPSWKRNASAEKLEAPQNPGKQLMKVTHALPVLLVYASAALCTCLARARPPGALLERSTAPCACSCFTAACHWIGAVQALRPQALPALREDGPGVQLLRARATAARR